MIKLHNINKYIIKPIIHISKRYYPGGKGIGHAAVNGAKVMLPGPLNSMTPSTSNRIVKLFTKDNKITDNFTQDDIKRAIDGLYQMTGNREAFFKTFRQIAKYNTLNFPVDYKDKNLTTISIIARMIRKYHYPEEITPQVLNKQKEIPQPLRTVSTEERREALIKKMEKMIEAYKKTENIDENVIDEWGQCIFEESSYITEYTEQEKNIISFVKQRYITLLKDFEEKYKLNEKTSSKDDKIKKLKELSNLPKNFTSENIPNECITDQDYINSIAYVKQALALLETDSLNDISKILLAISSDAASLDEENNPKLTREAYVLIKEHPEKFNIKRTDKKPTAEEIYQALKNKHFIIREGTNKIPEGHLLSTAPILHKTVLIFTKDGIYETSMLTSTKKNTELLSETQEINLDPEMRNKGQYFNVFPTFIVSDYKDGFILVDLHALGYTQDINLQGEDVLQKIIKSFKNKQSEWENNFAQKPLIIDAETLNNISRMFFSNKLKTLESNYNDFLAELEHLPEDKKKEILKEAEKLKNDKMKQLEEDKKFAQYPENLRKLYNLVKHIEKEETKHVKLKKKKNHDAELAQRKREREDTMRKAKEERARTGQLTAADRRELYEKEKAEKRKQIKNE